MITRRRLMLVSLMTVLCGAALAAEPPHPINYQGVLRGSGDEAVDGTVDMVFTFYSAETGGDEICADFHTVSGGDPVRVTKGLFNVRLNEEPVADGSGPGVYNWLSHVFAEYGEVWMAIRVEGETLAPRVPLVSVPYALNAKSLGGYRSFDFIDTRSGAQTKSGPLTLDASGQAAYGLEAYGQSGGGYFEDSNATGFAHVGYGNHGIEAYGTSLGGFFQDTNSSSWARIAYADYGLQAYGSYTGGFFQETDGSGNARVAYTDRGIRAQGNVAGGHFEDLDSSGWAYVAFGDRGIHAEGTTSGAYFKDGNSSGFAHVGWGDLGIGAEGTTAGGYFKDNNASGYAYVGWGDYGIYANGATAGARFDNGILVNGRTTTDSLEITGGADLAEPFPTTGDLPAIPGSVLIIDEALPGALRLSDRPYDPRVAGVVSGAGGIRPGITLRPDEAREEDVQLAMTGRVYCRATASNGSIRPGDLLTTAALPGHAMKVTDRERSQGTILGKAMSGLDKGEGLILVLVSLQ